MVPSRHRLRAAAAVLLAAFGVSGCGGTQQERAPRAEPAVLSNPVDPATAGSITGRISFDGTPPAPAPIKMGSDPYCEKQGAAVTESIVVDADGGTEERVRLREGWPRQLSGFRYQLPRWSSTRRPVDTCRTSLACRSASRSRSSTAIRRCTTSMRSRRRTASSTWASRCRGRTPTPSAPTEVMVSFKCDVHRWMNAYVGRARPPVLRGDDRRGTLRAERPSARHLHDRSVARNARRADRRR